MLSETLPIEEAPVNGWTMTSADKYCGETLRSSSAASSCAHVPDIDISSHVASCRGDLLHSGDSREAARTVMSRVIRILIKTCFGSERLILFRYVLER